MYKKTYDFRRFLKMEFGFPLKFEIHTRNFILNKKPYGGFLQLENEKRIEILDLYIDFIASLDIQTVNVVINKTAIRQNNYDVLDHALTYSIQRIENHLNKLDPTSKFMIITDTGRVGKMRKTSRKIQKINFIPSKFNSGLYRQEIRRLIEDPLPKDSDQSYFVQFADLISYVIYHYKRLQLGIGSFPNRFPNDINSEKINYWMNTLKPIFNLQASYSDPYGIVCYPK